MDKGLNTKKNGNQAMVKICGFIVDKRNLFFLLFGLLIIFSAISRNWVGVENSMSYYLPGTTETRQGLDLMEEEFITYGTCNVMLANVSYEQAENVYERLEKIEGVFSVDFNDTEEHYTNGSAFYNITFDFDEIDDACLVALDRVKELFADYDYYLTTSLGNTQAELIGQEMNTISVLVAVIVVSVLLLTTQAYAEIPVLLITFLSAAVIQMGTNFFLGTISFVSNSVTIVLQLALSVDYAVILLNRYKEEHVSLEAREAIIIALSKAIPEIAGSSLTTIGGLIAMTFMQYKMGPDLGVVLIKAILLSLCAVFLLMPGVIMLFSNLMDKTKHKNFIPDIPFVGKYAYFSRYIVAPLFLVAIVIGYMISKNCPYVFGYSTVTPPLQNRVQKAEEMQETNFGSSNMVALIVPAGNYDSEKAMLRDLDMCPEVDYTMGLANIEAMDGYHLTDKLTPRQFSELIDLDYEVAELIYTAYAVNDEDYAKVVNGLPDYQVPLIDMFMFVYDEVEEGFVTLESDLQETLDDAYRQMNFAKNQLQGENYSRMLVYLTLPEESEETFAFLDKMHDIAGKYYDGTVLVCGESVSQYDLQKTFSRDNMVVNVVSILVVLVVLLFTFKSAGMPVLLIAVIQGSIWINFSVPTLQHDNLFFLGYLIVSSIQMGANIDYAIVIASRYTDLRKTMGRKQSIIDTMNLSFPTIVTSGTMLAVAGILIGKMTSDVAIFGIGKCLGRGTLISIFITMFVLPQILLVGDKIIEKTAFVMNMPIRTKNVTGLMKVDGLVRGKIDGMVTGSMNAIIKGNVSAYVEAGDVTEITKEEYEKLSGEMADQIENGEVKEYV
ncbi:MMPL family transporter [Parablautia muri]|uniref:RND transporter n=1 Tax=Parablautia muri TaxID=2320879 RepID=A0A9X5BJA3_9FIRM|nr:MMPL family transporter [Parablautia muri]NBJ95100.1 RND transporter [Parablautia muri]